MRGIDAKAIGKPIKEVRGAKGFTQEERAAQVDMSAQHFSVIERGKIYRVIRTIVIVLWFSS